ncbi:hypothetical protein ES703_96297 [subsurface metagenome]
MLSQSAGLLLLCNNQILKYKKRTWFDQPRSHDQTMLGWKDKFIGISRIDDIRGELKKGDYVFRRQGPRQDKNTGRWAGSYATGQLTLKGCYQIVKHGNTVHRPAWGVAKKYYNPKKPTCGTQEKTPEPQDKHPPQQGENPYLDPGSRRSLGLPEIPPFEPEKT